MGERPPADGEPNLKRRGGDIPEEDQNQKGTVRVANAGNLGDVASAMFLHVLDSILKRKQGEPVSEGVIEVQKEVESVSPYLKALTSSDGLKDLAFLVMQDMLISRTLYNWSRDKIHVILRPTMHWTVPLMTEVMQGNYTGLGQYFTSEKEWREWCLSQVSAEPSAPKTNRPLPETTHPAALSKAEILRQKAAQRAKEGRLTKADYEYIVHQAPELAHEIPTNILQGGPKLTLALWEKGVKKDVFVGAPDSHYVVLPAAASPNVIKTTDPSNTEKKLALKSKWTTLAKEGNLDRRQYTSIVQYYPDLGYLIGVNIEQGGPKMSQAQAELAKKKHDLNVDQKWILETEARAAAPPAMKMDIEPIEKIPKTNKPPATKVAKASAPSRPKKTNKPLRGQPLPAPNGPLPKHHFGGSEYHLWNSRHPRFLYSAMHPDGVDAGRGFYEDPVPVGVYRNM